MYTEAQLLDYRAAVIEACAAVCEATHQTAGYGNNYADKLRGLK